MDELGITAEIKRGPSNNINNSNNFCNLSNNFKKDNNFDKKIMIE